MNLRSIVSGVIGTVNPATPVIYRRSTGYTKDASFKQVPAYAPDVTVTTARLQALTSHELARMNALNIQGVTTALYVDGIKPRGADRNTGTGGDLFIINNETWLVVQVLEEWPEWSRVALCRQ